MEITDPEYDKKQESIVIIKWLFAAMASVDHWSGRFKDQHM